MGGEWESIMNLPNQTGNEIDIIGCSVDADRGRGGSGFVQSRSSRKRTECGRSY
jgi:hypothetical protein